MSRQSEISERTKAMYDKSAQTYKENYTNVSRSATEFIEYIPCWYGKILEVGCGAGVDANFFAQNGRLVVATDISPKMIQQAQQEYPHQNINFLATDMFNLNFHDNEFD